MIKNIQLEDEKIFVATCADKVLVRPADIINTDSLEPCNHEEADTRMFLHALHASENGSLKVKIRSNDTDIIVLGTALFPQLDLEELEVTFGSGKTFRVIKIHQLYNALGTEKCQALLLFHSLTGCDSTTSLFGVPKHTDF